MLKAIDELKAIKIRGECSRIIKAISPYFGESGMGINLAVKVCLLWAWQWEPIAAGKGVRREAESEGNLRQNHDPMNKNCIQYNIEQGRTGLCLSKRYALEAEKLERSMAGKE